MTGVLLLLLLLSFFATTAVAAPGASNTLVLKTTFAGGVGAANGEFAHQENFAGNTIAVEPSTGNIIVADEVNDRLQVFPPDPTTGGTFLTSFPFQRPSGVAIDPGSGAIYVSGGSEEVTRYLSDGGPVPTYTVDPTFDSPPVAKQRGGIAVDPITHEILVSTASMSVTRLSPSGDVVSSFDASDAPGGPFSSPESIAMVPDGTFYVVDAHSRLMRFNQDDEYAGSVPATFPTSVAVDSSSGEVYVGEIEPFLSTRMTAFTPAGDFDFQISPAPAIRNAWDRGLAVDATGLVYSLTAESFVGEGFNGVSIYQPAILPGVEVPEVSQVTATGAHLSGKVDPGPVAPGETVAHFEYSSNEGQTWETTLDQPADISPVEADLVGLDPNVEYLVRLVASTLWRRIAPSPWPLRPCWCRRWRRPVPR